MTAGTLFAVVFFAVPAATTVAIVIWGAVDGYRTRRRAAVERQLDTVDRLWRQLSEPTFTDADELWVRAHAGATLNGTDLT